jgi:hypothetical protein
MYILVILIKSSSTYSSIHEEDIPPDDQGSESASEFRGCKKNATKDKKDK